MHKLFTLLLSFLTASSSWAYLFNAPTPVNWGNPPAIGFDGQPMSSAEQHTREHFSSSSKNSDIMVAQNPGLQKISRHFYQRSKQYSEALAANNPLHAVYVFNRNEPLSTHSDPFLDALFIPRTIFEDLLDEQSSWHNYSYSSEKGTCTLVMSAQFDQTAVPQNGDHISNLLAQNFFTIQKGTEHFTQEQKALFFEFIFAHEFAHCFYSSHITPTTLEPSAHAFFSEHLKDSALFPLVFTHNNPLTLSPAMMLRLHADRSDIAQKQLKETQADTLALFFLMQNATTIAQKKDLQAVLKFIYQWRTERTKMLSTELQTLHIGGQMALYENHIQRALQEPLASQRIFFSSTLPLFILLQYYDNSKYSEDFLAYFSSSSFPLHLSSVLIDARTKNVFALDYLNFSNEKYRPLFDAPWFASIRSILEHIGAHVQQTHESTAQRIALFDKLNPILLNFLKQP